MCLYEKEILIISENLPGCSQMIAEKNNLTQSCYLNCRILKKKQLHNQWSYIGQQNGMKKAVLSN